MPYKAKRQFLGDGVTYKEGDSVPESLNHSGAFSWLLGDYIEEVTEEPEPQPEEEEPTEHTEHTEHTATQGARMRASELNVDLDDVAAFTEKEGNISKHDVERYHKEAQQQQQSRQEEE